MNDFQGLLSGEYGFKPQGKQAPMAPPRSNHNTNLANSPVFDFDLSTDHAKTSSHPKSSSDPIFDDHDTIFRASNSARFTSTPNVFANFGSFDDVFGGNSKSAANSSANLDSIFSGSEPKFSSLPVFDKPVYDEDVDAFDELLGGLGRKESELKPSGVSASHKVEKKDISGFDDLLPGFGTTTGGDRATSGRSWAPKSPATETRKASSGADDPFVGLNSSSPPASSSPGKYGDPLEQIRNLSSSSEKKAESSSTGGVFDDLDPLGDLGKSVPMNNQERTGSPVRTGSIGSGGQDTFSHEEGDKFSSVNNPERGSENKTSTEDHHESPRNIFDKFSAPIDSDRSFPNSSSSYSDSTNEMSSRKHTSFVYEEKRGSSDDVWLTVSEIPLFTQPTAAAPPSRLPPPRPPRSNARPGSVAPSYAKQKADEYLSFSGSTQVPQSIPVVGQGSFVSSIDELEDFAHGRSCNNVDGSSNGDDIDTNSVAAASAAAMKEAMDRAEARFRHAKEMRERENAKAYRMQQEKDEKTTLDFQERESREVMERLEHKRQEREVEERKQREEEERLRIEREKEERERERRRIERERELARQAVERATREARERAAAEARVRAEKSAVEKVQAEARERAERAAVLRAQAEARERAARAAAEAKQKADRGKAEREAREKAEREAREKVFTRASQQKNENDLESFFGGGSRASSAPRPSASSSFQNKQSESVRSSVSSASNIRKASSSTNIVDDLSSIFGAASASGEFQEVEGESEERRRARLERQQRTQERAAKALAEKNQRDLEAQREQAERHRIAETIDVEIRRWASGREGNLRALLSTLQYVLWPECGWQPVSLTDLITAASVKKVYRKATLCIHPDKVQQKGATLQQKYIAEKVFDLLKEAWNKFNSEELF